MILFVPWLLGGKVYVFVKDALLIERTFFFGDRSNTGDRARDRTTISVKRKVELTILTKSSSEGEIISFATVNEKSAFR